MIQLIMVLVCTVLDTEQISNMYLALWLATKIVTKILFILVL